MTHHLDMAHVLEAQIVAVALAVPRVGNLTTASCIDGLVITAAQLAAFLYNIDSLVSHAACLDSQLTV